MVWAAEISKASLNSVSPEEERKMLLKAEPLCLGGKLSRPTPACKSETWGSRAMGPHYQTVTQTWTNNT